MTEELKQEIKRMKEYKEQMDIWERNNVISPEDLSEMKSIYVLDKKIVDLAIEFEKIKDANPLPEKISDAHKKRVLEIIDEMKFTRKQREAELKLNADEKYKENFRSKRNDETWPEYEEKEIQYLKEKLDAPMSPEVKKRMEILFARKRRSAALLEEIDSIEKALDADPDEVAEYALRKRAGELVEELTALREEFFLELAMDKLSAEEAKERIDEIEYMLKVLNSEENQAVMRKIESAENESLTSDEFDALWGRAAEDGENDLGLIGLAEWIIQDEISDFLDELKKHRVIKSKIDGTELSEEDVFNEPDESDEFGKSKALVIYESTAIAKKIVKRLKDKEESLQDVLVKTKAAIFSTVEEI